ncbi:MAG: hypothetical protein ACFE8B_04285 [Candidatus Hermodarchaeota archaeon]
MDKEELTDDELDDELEKAFKENLNKKDVFSIIRKEKESLDVKEKRIKEKFKH